jgi:hypothetical protein
MDRFTALGNEQMNNIKKKYKVIEVPWFDSVQVTPTKKKNETNLL